MFGKNKGGVCGKCGDTGLFLVRLALAIVFIVHGWQKLSNMDMTIEFFAALGLGAFLAWLVALVELLGGVAMLVGFFTQVAGIILAINMLFAIILVHAANGFFLPAGYEFTLTLLLVSLGVAFMGPGKFGADKKCCFGKCGSAKAGE